MPGQEAKRKRPTATQTANNALEMAEKALWLVQRATGGPATATEAAGQEPAIKPGVDTSEYQTAKDARRMGLWVMVICGAVQLINVLLMLLLKVDLDNLPGFVISTGEMASWGFMGGLALVGLPAASYINSRGKAKQGAGATALLGLLAQPKEGDR